LKKKELYTSLKIQHPLSAAGKDVGKKRRNPPSNDRVSKRHDGVHLQRQDHLIQQPKVEKTAFDLGTPCYYLPSTEEYLLRKELEEAKKENQEFEEMLIRS